MTDLRYVPPTRRGLPVEHYLVAVDPGTARPGVSVWHVDQVARTLAPTTTPAGVARCALVVFEWSPTLIAGRAPRPPRNPDHFPGSAAAAARLVGDVVDALTAKHRATPDEYGRTRSRDPIALVVEWPVYYATNTAARSDVRGLRDMIAALPWTPRPGGKWSPSAWKGNVPKEITTARTFAALPVGADLVVDDDPNARDAVAIGAYALGIVGRGCAKC